MNGEVAPPRWVWRALVAIALAVSIAVVAVGAVTAWSAAGRQNRIEAAQAQQVCIARIQGAFFSHIAALLTTPFDARMALAADIERDGRRLQNLDQHCPT